MGIFSKVDSTGSSTDWRVTKKVWAKVSSGWVAATGVFGKTINGWVKMWPGNAPSVRASDPIRIRIGGYTGTLSGVAPLYAATSPQLFANNYSQSDNADAGTSGTFLKLWGDDGQYDGVTPITLSNRRMLCSDNIDGQVERFSLTGNDTIDFATVSQATRDLAEGYYIFYQLLATNVDGSLDAYSQPIKVIKRKPALVSYGVFSESGGSLQGANGYNENDVIEVNAQIRWGWWIRPGGYLGGIPVLRWWRNTSKSPGGTKLKEINIETGYDYVSGTTDPTYTFNTNTSNVLTIYNNYTVANTPLQSGEYIIAELYLENSYTAHYGAPVSYWGSTGARPSISSVAFRTFDGQVDTVMDNQSEPKIVSDAYFEIVAQVADYQSGTTFNFEPRIFKIDTGVYLNYENGSQIGTSSASAGFPTDVAPYSISASGTSATVIWRTYINSNFLTGSPTYSGGQTKNYFEYRISAIAPGGGISYFSGDVSSYHGNDPVFAGSVSGASGGSIKIHYHTQSVLSANAYTVGSAPQTIRFSVTGDSYPSGYASYPRSYGIDFGDGNVENISWPIGTSNPSYTTWDHTYANNGTYTARLITVPQGFTTIGTRQRTITVGGLPSTPTFLTATTNRTDGVELTFGGSSNATSYDLYWNPNIGNTPSNSTTPDFPGVSSPYLDSGIGSNTTRYYWVRGKNASGTSNWYPVGNGVQGTRTAAVTPTITNLTASAPTTATQQLVTVTVSWSSTNQASYNLTVTQTGVASFNDTGTTQTSSNTADSGNLFRVYSGASATILLTIYSGANQTGTSATQTITYTPPLSQTTYGPCEFWYTYDTYECSSIYNRDVSTTYYKRKVYVDGVWDGSTYDYSESACTPAVTYGSYKLTNGRCGYTEPVYQYYCTTNYRQAGIPNDQYTSSTDESEVVCNSYRTVCSYNNTGSYPSASEPPACATTTTTTTTTTACVCVYQDMGSYHYSPQCCPSGSARSGSLSGTTSGACCPNVNKTQKYNCNSFDVNNSTSANYFLCYSIGQCAATSNSAGTRTTCYV